MNRYEGQSEEKERYKKRSHIFISVGLLTMVSGISLFVLAIIIGDFEISPALAIPGMFIAAAGFVLAVVGSHFRFLARTGEITSYIATETSPTMKISSESITDGIASGLEKHNIEIGQKEVVKIKCRNCGYLETEDAEFCSKCGQPM